MVHFRKNLNIFRKDISFVSFVFFLKVHVNNLKTHTISPDWKWVLSLVNKKFECYQICEIFYVTSQLFQ